MKYSILANFDNKKNRMHAWHIKYYLFIGGNIFITSYGIHQITTRRDILTPKGLLSQRSFNIRHKINVRIHLITNK